MPHPNRIKLSLAGTAAVALASLPLGIIPANAAKVSEGTSESISVVEAASNAAQFNLKTQGVSTNLVAQSAIASGGRFPRLRALLLTLLELIGLSRATVDPTPPTAS